MRSILEKQLEFQVVAEEWNGLEAVQKAQELQPGLILLDLGLPTLNGIEAARRIRQVSPASEILFVSGYRSWDIAEAALGAAAGGYLVKSDAASHLLPAVELVLQGRQFISPSLTRHNSGVPENDYPEAITHCHEVAFYPDDISVVDGCARLIESGLKNGNAVIVVVTEAHRANLLSRLGADGVDVAAVIDQVSCVLLDATDTLSKVTVNGWPERVRCAKVVGDLVVGAAKGLKGEPGRVAVCGEIAPTLLSNGTAEGAIHLEHLWDEITRSYGVHTLCGYVWSTSRNKEGNPIFERIRAGHSAVSSR